MFTDLSLGVGIKHFEPKGTEQALGGFANEVASYGISE